MANYLFNIAKGRAGEFAYRVKNADPSASRLFLIAISTDVAQATAVDVDDFGAFVTAGGVEATNGSYTKKTIAAADVIAVGPQDASDTYTFDINDMTWTAVAAGVSWVALILGYSSVTSPTNAQIVPISHHDFAVTPDGSDITAQIASGGIYSAA